MASARTANRSASQCVEEYRDIPHDTVSEEEGREDDPLLQATAEPIVQQPRKLTLLEIPTFLYFVALVIQYPLQQFWLFDHFSRQYNWEKTNETDDCANSSYSNNSRTENEVQARTNQYVMYTSFVSSFTAIFPTLFLGPLTDKFGRKFIFYIGLLFLFFSELLTLMVFQFNLSPNFLLVSSFIQGLSGSYGLYLTAVFGMVADISSPGKQRTFRVASTEAFIALGASIGMITSGIWVKKMGYVWPMVFSLGLILLAAFFLLFFIPESYTDRHRQPFSCKNLIKCFQFYVKDTPNGRRFKLLVCLISFMIAIASMDGESNFGMLFLLHQPFCWHKTQITVLSGVVTLLKWIVVMMFVHLGKRWISEPVYALIGGVSATCCYLLKSLATSNVLIFAGAGIGLTGGFLTPMCRTIMSRAVSQKEQGALFSSIGVLQMIVSAVSGVVMSVIYNAGLRVYLGLPYVVLAALSLLSSILLLSLVIHKKRHPEQDTPFQVEERIVN